MKKKADVIKPHKIKDVDQQLGFNAFPYTSLLSFAPLITYWKKKCNSRDRGEAILAKEIITQLDGALELQQPVRDPSQLIHHRDFINLLMSGIFPLAQRNQQMAQATKGFSLEGFYQTNRLRKFLKTNRLNIVNNKDPERVRQDAIIRAGCMILNAFYGQQFPLKDPYVFSARSEDTLVETHYKAALNLDFFEIKKKLGLPAISQEQIFELISNFDRPDLWLERLPPSHFEFHGLITVQFIDITEEEAISRLRQFLLQKDSVLEGQSIAKMEELLASYFNIPGMRLGLTEFSYPDTKMANQSLSLRHHILGNSYSSLKGLGFAGSIYEQVCQSKQATIFEDIDKIERKSPLELALLEEGIHSIYVAPLQGKDGTIFALLEFGAPAAYALNSFSKIKINEIQPLFRTAFSRKIEELNNEISALIRQRFTNIHPTVEWRFLEEATRLLRAKKWDYPI